jgi:hypothetical protein
VEYRVLSKTLYVLLALCAICYPAQLSDPAVEKGPSEGRARELARQVEDYK